MKANLALLNFAPRPRRRRCPLWRHMFQGRLGSLRTRKVRKRCNAKCLVCFRTRRNHGVIKHLASLGQMWKFLKIANSWFGNRNIAATPAFYFYVTRGTLKSRSRQDGHTYLQLQKRKFQVYIRIILLFSVPLSWPEVARIAALYVTALYRVWRRPLTITGTGHVRNNRKGTIHVYNNVTRAKLHSGHPKIGTCH